MEKKNIKLLIWSMLLALVIVAVPTAFRLLPQMFGTTYEDSDEFQSEMTSFYNDLTRSVLNPVTFDQLEERLTVTPYEIEEHQNRYGSLSDQIENIVMQYEGRIDEAESLGNSRLKETLMKERDMKIADIEKNFEDLEHVREKVLKEKIEVFKEYFRSGDAHSEIGFPVAYQLKDIETGEVFEKGDLGVPEFYQDTFDNERPFKAVSPIYQEGGDTMIYIGQFEYKLTELATPTKQFEGVVMVPKRALEGTIFKERFDEFNQRKYRNYGLWSAALLAFVLIITKFKLQKQWITENPIIQRFSKLKIDIQLILFAFMLFVFANIFWPNAEGHLFYNHAYSGALLDQLITFGAFALVLLYLVVQAVLLIDRWQQPDQLEEDIQRSYIVDFLKNMTNLFLNRTLGIQLFILLIGFFLAGIGFMVVLVEPYAILLYIPLVVFLGLPALYLFARRGAYLSKVFVATEKMANGQLQEAIPVKGKSPIAKHAEHLNALQEGVRISMGEQAKSERLKTELITNVSHDLRTPLTSIITYTDLLKTKDLSEEERLKYVEILDKKSARLKTLIEDLFEVSKMASGNLELHKQKVDLTQLLKQSLAEHEEDISNTSLDFRVQLPETAIYAYVDGQRWWRMLDNLIVNALKYSLSNTRVYVTLEEQNNQAKFTIKNISQYALNDNSDELFERFKRGDESRHTDGSGLGLAIAQSIVDMHGGQMKIEVDGDLFKVTVELPKF